MPIFRDYNPDRVFSNHALKLAFMVSQTKDISILRRDPEGRQFLYEEALKRRRVPLKVRRAPRLMGRAAGQFASNLAVKVLSDYGNMATKPAAEHKSKSKN